LILGVGNLAIDGGTLHGGNWDWLIESPSAQSTNAAIAYDDTEITLGANGLTVELNTRQDKTLSRALTGSGALTKTGEGTLTLSGAHAYTGGTTVQSGTLELGNAASLASAALTLHGGATFKDGSGGGGYSLDDGHLTVRGENATYDGDLSARDATLTFIVPANVSQPLLNVTGDADITGGKVSVGVSGAASLPIGARLTLVQADNLTADNLTEGAAIVEAGVTTLYQVSLTPDPATGLLSGTVTSGGSTERAKALSEGLVSGLSLVSRSADAIAGQGMASAVKAARGGARGGAAGGPSLAGFGAVSGGSLRYKTGSHVDAKSLSLLAGLSLGLDLAPGRLTLGAFAEYGDGSYDTYNSFAAAASVHGDGDFRHLGGGLLARMDFQGAGPGRFYAEASVRGGRARNEYRGADLLDRFGREAAYESSSDYYGLHLGAGYVWSLADAADLELYAKYFWTRQEGDSAALSTGESLRFEDADSSRLRLGARLACKVGERVGLYAGAAWEREFDGRARASSNGFAIEAPSLRGDTGVGELGVTIRPSASLPLDIDLGVQGHAGKREGVTWSLRLRFEF
jgi:outer membrane autotransporter protein